MSINYTPHEVVQVAMKLHEARDPVYKNRSIDDYFSAAVQLLQTAQEILEDEKKYQHSARNGNL